MEDDSVISNRSSPVRILNVEPLAYSDEAQNIYRHLGQIDQGPFDRSELLSIVGQYDVLLVRLAHQIDREVLERASRLSVIVTPTTGLDHIDLEAAGALGIDVLSLRDQADFLKEVRATAEHTWGLLLSVTRRIPDAHRHVVDGGWNRDEFRGVDLAGRHLGLLGFGRIGEMVARYGICFCMEVAAYDPYRDSWLDGVKRVASIDELMMTSDVLSIHLHLTSETEGLVGREMLSLMPDGAYLINTSRGEVLIEDDLLEVLESRRIAGAAVDVIAGERSTNHSRLIDYARRHDNLIITPHIAGATHEAMKKTEVHMARLLAEYLGQEHE